MDKSLILHDKICAYLTYRQFTECLNICSTLLLKSKQLSDKERLYSSDVEWLCLVSIQAYAELNRWSEVLPFVTQLYNGLEDTPPKVIQSCLLLHASVNDYPTCTAISNIWLRNPNNFKLLEYNMLVEMFIAKVLIPLDKWSDIDTFINSCTGIEKDINESYRKNVKILQRKKEQEEIDKIQEIDSENNKVNSDLNLNNDCSSKDNYKKESLQSNHNNKIEGPLLPFTSYIRLITEWVKRKTPSTLIFCVQNFSLFAVILYFLLTRWNYDVLSYDTLSSIMGVMSQLWNSMFAPFHMARSQ